MIQIYKSSIRHIKFIAIFLMFIALLVTSLHFETQKDNKPSKSGANVLTVK